MKCFVCNNEFDGNICPRCQFPKVFIPGDYETGLKKIQPEIDAYRDEFLNGIEVGIVTYFWKDENGTVVLDREERLPFGKGKDLRGNTLWLEQLFARIPDEELLKIRVYIKTGDKECEKTVCLPNLFEAELQQIGIYTDEEYRFKLLLKNDTGTPTGSDFIAIFS